MPPSSCAERLAKFAAGAFASATIAALASGCSAACDPSPEANTPEVFSAGVTRDGAYETGAWSGPHLPFPGGKRWTLEHHLGFAPRTVSVYLAFGGDNTELAPCAGNSCVLCVDDQYVWLRNDTCSEFWVRVVAEGRDPAAPNRRCDEERLTSGSDVDASDASASAEETSPSDATADASGPLGKVEGGSLGRDSSDGDGAEGGSADPAFADGGDR